MKKLLFIINPMAGRQQAQTDLYKMVKIFADHDYEVTVYPTRARLDCTRKVLEDALDDVVNLATVSVGAMEQTTAKALRDAVKSGKAKPEELAALGKQVFDEVKAAISPQAQQVITDNLGSFDKYLTAVIEDAVLKVKQADPYITLSGELAEGVELPAAGGTQ